MRLVCLSFLKFRVAVYRRYTVEENCCEKCPGNGDAVSQSPHVILWDTRISDSDDEDALYYKTSRLARELDVYRQTGGERDFAGSHFYEDVYLYDDMSEDAASASISSENINQDLLKTCLLSGHRSLNVQGKWAEQG